MDWRRTVPATGALANSARPDDVAADRRSAAPLSWRPDWPGEAATVGFIACLAQLARVTGISILLFPELGALAHDVFTRPHGTWARNPVMLALTPFLTALLGSLLTRELGYGPLAVLLSVGGAVLIIEGLRSPVAPAISAGLLPLTLDLHSPWYPPCILLSSSLLAIASVLYRRWAAGPAVPRGIRDIVDDAVEQPARRLGRLLPYFAFIGLDACLAQRTGWRFLLFPPLAVIAYEMFAHPTICPWTERPLALLTGCSLCALVGWVLVSALGTSALAAICAMTLGIVVLRALDLRVPSALSVNLLPFVIDRPSALFPVAVAGGVGVLVLCVFLSRRL